MKRADAVAHLKNAVERSVYLSSEDRAALRSVLEPVPDREIAEAFSRLRVICGIFPTMPRKLGQACAALFTAAVRWREGGLS